MPLYDFRCLDCGHTFEARTAPGAGASCPACGAPEAERLLRPFVGPFTVAPRGVAARRSDAARSAREEQRREDRARRRAQREQQ